MRDEHDITQQQKEDFWLELGPAGAYYGIDSYDTALKNGDASPDADRLGWPGAEPGRDALDEEDEALDDVPPIDR